MPEEVKKKISEALKGRTFTAEVLQKNRVAHLGEKNARWAGDNVKRHAGMMRAKRRFPKTPCEVCGKIKSEIHHIDGNDLNNSPENITHLCRRHHMEIDGRLSNLVKRNKQGKMIGVL